MPKFTRRRLLAGGGLFAATAALAAARPRDRSGPRSAYFLRLQAALRAAGVATPTLVIDRARLLANVDTLMGHLPKGMAYRVVAKSLPAPDLIQTVRNRAQTSRLMTFNLPMLRSISEAMPEVDQLIGKPLPVRAAQRYFDDLKTTDAAGKVQWLVDTIARVDEYEALARARDMTLRLNIEIDVGLHRGGFRDDESLATALHKIAESPHLRFAGFMGYEPHVAAVPETFGLRANARDAAWTAYAAALRLAEKMFGESAMAGCVRNAAGSPTYRLYRSTDIANEVSVGSVLVKPTHYDTDLLVDHQPASFIATPVIKASDRTTMPSLLAYLDGVKHAWDPNYRKTLFIYGGHWMADPVDPPGLAYNSAFGRSSNQEMLNAGENATVEVNDFVFFRPQQSEAVFLRFGDIAVYDDGKIREWWRPFSAAA